MTLSAGPDPEPTAPLDDPDGAPLAVAVGRSIGGVLMTIAGAAIILGALFLLFGAPFLGDGWEIWLEFSDFFWVPVAIGGVLAVWGVTFVRRARKVRLEEPGSVTAATAAPTPEAESAPAEKRTGTPPPTIV